MIHEADVTIPVPMNVYKRNKQLNKLFKIIPNFAIEIERSSKLTPYDDMFNDMTNSPCSEDSISLNDLKTSIFYKMITIQSFNYKLDVFFNENDIQSCTNDISAMYKTAIEQGTTYADLIEFKKKLKLYQTRVFADLANTVPEATCQVNKRKLMEAQDEDGPLHSNSIFSDKKIRQTDNEITQEALESNKVDTETCSLDTRK